MPSFLLLAPPLVLAGGAFLAQRPPARLRAVQDRLPVIAALVATLLSLAVVALAAWPGGQAHVTTLTLSAWSKGTFGTEPGLEVDLLAALVVCLVCAGAFIGALRGWSEGEAAVSAAWPLAVAGAAVLLVEATCRPLGLVLGWVALDGALFLAGGRRRRGLIAGQAGLSLAMAGLVGLPFASQSLCQATAADLSAVGRHLLLAACMIRMGLYPVWWSVPHTDTLKPWQGCVMRVAPTLAGAHLVLRLAALASPTEEVTTWLILPGLVGLGFGALLAWLAGHRVESVDWSTTVQASLVLIAASIGGPIGQAIALLLVLDLAIGRTMRFAGNALGRSRIGRVARWMSGASLAGLPPTLGSAARWLLYQQLLTRELRGGLLVIVLASALAAAPALIGSALQPPLRPQSRWTLMTVGILAALQLGLGLFFFLLQPLLVAVTGVALYNPILDMLQTARQLVSPAGAQNFANNLFLLVAVLIPPAIGGLLQRLRRPARAVPAPDTRQRRMQRTLLLDHWLRDVLARFIRSGEMVQARTGWVDSGRTMAWTLLAVTVTGTAMMALGVTSTTDVPMPAPAGPLLAIVLFLAAAVLAGILVLGSAPALTLGALAGAYLLVAAVILNAAGISAGSAAVPSSIVVIVALVKVLAGLLVVVILAVSVLQAPGAHRAGGTARRLGDLGALGGLGSLRGLHGLPLARAERMLPATALMVAMVVAYGLAGLPVATSSLGLALTATVLRPALALVAGGALTMLFARTPLRLAGGVLMALAGFELIYARLDPGLVITAGLALFQLLLAILASSFVGAPGGEIEASR